MSCIHQAFQTWMRIVLAMGMFSLAQPVIGEPGIPFRLSSSAVEPVPMQLDAADRQWLASQGTLRIGIATVDYEPVDIITDRNNYQGLSADYLSILRDKLGVPVEVLGYRTREQAVARLLAGEVDILTSASGFERGIEGVVLSQEYMADRLVVVCRTDDEGPVGNWAGKKIGFMAGYVDFHTAQAFYPSSEIVIIADLHNAMDALTEGDIDAFIGNELIVQSFKSFRPHSGLRIVGDSALPAFGFAFATRHSSSRLASLIDRALESLDERATRMVLSRWTSGLEGSIAQQRIDLLPTEREWIQRNPVVTLATQQFPLYSFRTGDGRWAGLSIDLLARISRMTGLQFVHKEAFSTVQILDMLKSGEAQMNSSLSRSRERKAFLNFTYSYGGAPWVFVVRVNDSRLGSLSQLAGKVLVLPARHALEDYIRREYPAVTLRLVDTYAQARHAVANGDADATIQTETQAYLYPPGRLKVGRSVEGQWAAATFSVPARYPELFSIMNKALEAIPVADIRALRTTWLGGAGQPLIIEGGLYHSPGLWWAIAGLCSVGLMSLFYNGFLRRQLGAGREYELSLKEQLKLSHRFLDGIPSPIFVVGLEGQLITCNQSYEERLSVRLGKICGLKVTEVDLFSQELAEKFQREILNMIQSRKPCYQKRWVEFKTGGMEIYQWAAPFYSETGRMEGLVGGWFDKSDARKWEVRGIFGGENRL